MDQTRPLFCLFSSFSHYNFNNTNWKKCRWCAWDSNLRPKDYKCRWYHGAMAAAFPLTLLPTNQIRLNLKVCISLQNREMERRKFGSVWAVFMPKFRSYEKTSGIPDSGIFSKPISLLLSSGYLTPRCKFGSIGTRSSKQKLTCDESWSSLVCSRRRWTRCIIFGDFFINTTA